ncbi:MAG: hypothetical protein ABJA80_04020 [bacterium]
MMGTRERKAMPWGAGLDRASGAIVVREDQFSDLRNVYLTNGRAELRKGLARALVTADGSDLLGVWPIRAQGLAGAVTYNTADRKVKLWAIDSTGTVANYITTLWTLNALATLPPSVIAADSYDKLVIAHDEPILGLREETYVFAPADGTVEPLLADFARTGTPVAVRFRGVARHLNYLVGWGYGTSAEEDRPETLRISEAGEPTNFKPEHYFLVGAQGDPIVGVGYCGGALAIMKIADSAKLIGYDRATFGIRPLDPAYGMLGSRLHASVNDEFYFWSLTGPRYSTGDASNDLGSPLALEGVSPDVIEGTTPKDKGFAYFDATNREVVFVFGQWAYVLHLRDGAKKWSYRTFGHPLVSAGSLYLGGSIILAITAHPEPGAVAFADATYVGADTLPKLTVPWTIVGGAVTTERCEVWMKSHRTGSTWSRRGSYLATDLTATVPVEDFWQTYDIALRFVQSGYAALAYSDTYNPGGWPGVSQATHDTGGEVVSWLSEGFVRFDISDIGFVMDAKGPGDPGGGNALMDITFTVEISADAGATWTALTSGLNLLESSAVAVGNALALTTQRFRIKANGPVGSSAWYETPDMLVAPENTGFLVVGPTDIPGGPNTGADTHALTWGSPPDINGFPQPDGPFDIRARHRDRPDSGGVLVGAYSAIQVVAEGVHATTAAAPGYDPSTGVGRRYEAQIRVNRFHAPTGMTDVSPWFLGVIDEA